MNHTDHIKYLQELQGNPPPSIPICKVGSGRVELSKLGFHTAFGPGRYLVFGGSPGTGKTSWLDQHLVLAPLYKMAKEGGDAPYWVYRSMERPKLHKRTKWLAWLHFVETGEALSVATLLNWSNKQRTLTAEDWRVLRSYDWFFELVDKHVDIVQGSSSPESIRDYALNVAQQRGVYVTMEDDMVLCNGKPAGHFQKEVYEEKGGVKRHYLDLSFGRVFEGEDSYFPSKEADNVQMVTDHLDKLLPSSEGGNPKDKHAGYVCDILRDICGWGATDIMQFNRDNQDTARLNSESLQVKEKDFRGSSIPYQNADIVMGVLDPWGQKKTKHEGYELEEMLSDGGQMRFRYLDLIKNSYGTAPLGMGYMFVGEVGYFCELPKSSEITDLQYSQIRSTKFR